MSEKELAIHSIANLYEAIEILEKHSKPDNPVTLMFRFQVLDIAGKLFVFGQALEKAIKELGIETDVTVDRCKVCESIVSSVREVQKKD